MKLKTTEITKQQSKSSIDLTYEKDALSKMFKITLVVLIIIEIILYLSFLPKISDEEAVLNFFGFIVKMSNPFWTGILFVILISFIDGLFVFIYLMFIKFLSAKIDMLDNTYRTMLLTEQILNVLSNNKEEISDNQNDSQNLTDIDK